MIANIKNTLDILKKYDIRPTKKLGQNFLVDVNVLRKIITAAGISKNDGVIEIGAGIGALTEALVEAAGRVLAYETDKRFINVLKNELDKRDNLKIFAGDFLKADINDDLGWLSECERILVVSNLPYYITTPIIFKLLEEAQPISEFYLMVQKEVARAWRPRREARNIALFRCLWNIKQTLKCYLKSRNIAFTRNQTLKASSSR